MDLFQACAIVLIYAVANVLFSAMFLAGPHPDTSAVLPLIPRWADEHPIIYAILLALPVTIAMIIRQSTKGLGTELWQARHKVLQAVSACLAVLLAVTLISLFTRGDPVGSVDATVEKREIVHGEEWLTFKGDDGAEWTFPVSMRQRPDPHLKPGDKVELVLGRNKYWGDTFALRYTKK
jgi:hypothetical protein